MKIEIFEGNWKISDVKNNPDKIFIFGDNDARLGKGGQAIIRDLPNAMGIRTKKGPSKKAAAFYKDSQLQMNSEKILEDILQIKAEALNGSTIVLAKGGYGTGLASLKEKAPKTFEYLCEQLREHFYFNNETGQKWHKIPGHNEITTGTYIDFDDQPGKKPIILKPTNNSYFKPEYLEKSLNTNFDLIKNGKKVAFSSKLKFQNGQILIFTFKGQKDYLVCRVIDSYDIQLVMKNYQWYSFEGYDKTFSIAGPETLINYKYQTHFQFICTLDTSGKMVFKDEIFTDKKKVSSSREDIEKSKEKLDNSENVKKIYSEENKDIKMNKPVSNEEIYEILKRIESKLDKKPFRLFKKKTMEEVIAGRVKGTILEIKKIDSPLSDNKYQVTLSKDGKTFYCYINYKKGFFSNKVEVLLTSNTPMSI